MAQARGSALLSKRRKLSAAVSEDQSYFSRDEEDFDDLVKGFQLKNTKTANSWALKIYCEWAQARSKKKGVKVTEMSLLTEKKEDLCEELCKFVVEIQKCDKTHYPPRSIQLILCGLQRYIRQERPQSLVNFTTDAEFQ